MDTNEAIKRLSEIGSMGQTARVPDQSAAYTGTAGYSGRVPVPQEEIDDPISAFKAGVQAGTLNLRAQTNNFKASVNTLLGRDSIAEDQLRRAELIEQDAGITMSGMEQFETFLEQPTFYGFINQVAAATGQFVPSVAVSIAAAATGGGVATGLTALTARAAAPRLGGAGAAPFLKTAPTFTAAGDVVNRTPKQLRNLITKAYKNAANQKQGLPPAYVIKKSDQELLERTIYPALKREARQRAGMRGALAGAFGQEFVQGSGIAFGEYARQDMTSTEDVLKSYAQGTIFGGIGVGSEALVAGSLFRTLKKGRSSLKNTLKDSDIDNLFKVKPKADTGFFKDLFRVQSTTAFSEGVAEALQEELSIQQKFRIDDTYKQANAKLDRLHALFAGFFGGVGVGTGLGTVPAVLNKSRQLTNRAVDQEFLRKFYENRVRQVRGDRGVIFKQRAANLREEFKGMFDRRMKKNSVFVDIDSESEFRKIEAELQKQYGNRTVYTVPTFGAGVLFTTNANQAEIFSNLNDADPYNTEVRDEFLVSALGYTRSRKEGDDTVVGAMNKKTKEFVSFQATTSKREEGFNTTGVQLVKDKLKNMLGTAASEYDIISQSLEDHIEYRKRGITADTTDIGPTGEPIRVAFREDDGEGESFDIDPAQEEEVQNALRAQELQALAADIEKGTLDTTTPEGRSNLRAIEAYISENLPFLTAANVKFADLQKLIGFNQRILSELKKGTLAKEGLGAGQRDINDYTKEEIKAAFNKVLTPGEKRSYNNIESKINEVRPTAEQQQARGAFDTPLAIFREYLGLSTGAFPIVMNAAGIDVTGEGQRLSKASTDRVINFVNRTRQNAQSQEGRETLVEQLKNVIPSGTVASVISEITTFLTSEQELSPFGGLIEQGYSTQGASNLALAVVAEVTAAIGSVAAQTTVGRGGSAMADVLEQSIDKVNSAQAEMVVVEEILKDIKITSIDKPIRKDFKNNKEYEEALTEYQLATADQTQALLNNKLIEGIGGSGTVENPYKRFLEAEERGDLGPWSAYEISEVDPKYEGRFNYNQEYIHVNFREEMKAGRDNFSEKLVNDYLKKAKEVNDRTNGTNYLRIVPLNYVSELRKNTGSFTAIPADVMSSATEFVFIKTIPENSIELIGRKKEELRDIYDDVRVRIRQAKERAKNTSGEAKSFNKFSVYEGRERGSQEAMVDMATLLEGMYTIMLRTRRRIQEEADQTADVYGENVSLRRAQAFNDLLVFFNEQDIYLAYSPDFYTRENRQDRFQIAGQTAPPPSTAKPSPRPKRQEFKPLTKVISGGQTGADIAFTEVAFEIDGLDTGGTIPFNNQTEAGPLSSLDVKKYKFKSKGSYNARTKQNVLDSDGTIIFVKNKNEKLSPGSALTARIAQEEGKPFFVADPSTTVEQIRGFIKHNNIQVLNGAGSRLSKLGTTDDGTILRENFSTEEAYQTAFNNQSRIVVAKFKNTLKKALSAPKGRAISAAAVKEQLGLSGVARGRLDNNAENKVLKFVAEDRDSGIYNVKGSNLSIDQLMSGLRAPYSNLTVMQSILSTGKLERKLDGFNLPFGTQYLVDGFPILFGESEALIKEDKRMDPIDLQTITLPEVEQAIDDILERAENQVGGPGFVYQDGTALSPNSNVVMNIPSNTVLGKKGVVQEETIIGNGTEAVTKPKLPKKRTKENMKAYEKEEKAYDNAVIFTNEKIRELAIQQETLKALVTLVNVAQSVGRSMFTSEEISGTGFTTTLETVKVADEETGTSEPLLDEQGQPEQRFKLDRTGNLQTGFTQTIDNIPVLQWMDDALAIKAARALDQSLIGGQGGAGEETGIYNNDLPSLVVYDDTQTTPFDQDVFENAEQERAKEFGGRNIYSLMAREDNARKVDPVELKKQIDKFLADKANKPINVFAGTNENTELSNFANRPFTGKEGKKYNSVEHAYQSNKTGKFNKKVYDEFIKLKRVPTKAWLRKNAGKPKTKGNANLKLMKNLMRESFNQNPKAKEKLLATGTRTITHKGGKTTDIFTKVFPQQLMELRAEFAKEKPLPAEIETPETEVTRRGEKPKVVYKKGVAAVKKAEANNEGISVLRKPGNKHYGNPFTHLKTKTRADVQVDTIEEAVSRYTSWLEGTSDTDLQQERRQWIIDQVDNGALDNKNLLYYSEQTPNHAEALANFAAKEKPLPSIDLGERGATGTPGPRGTGQIAPPTDRDEGRGPGPRETGQVAAPEPDGVTPAPFSQTKKAEKYQKQTDPVNKVKPFRRQIVTNIIKAARSIGISANLTILHDNEATNFGPNFNSKQFEKLRTDFLNDSTKGGMIVSYSDRDVIVLKSDVSDGKYYETLMHELGESWVNENLEKALKNPKIRKALEAEYKKMLADPDAPAAYKDPATGFQEMMADQFSVAIKKKLGIDINQTANQMFENMTVPVKSWFKRLVNQLVRFYDSLNPATRKRFQANETVQQYIDEVAEKVRTKQTKIPWQTKAKIERDVQRILGPETFTDAQLRKVLQQVNKVFSSKNMPKWLKKIFYAADNRLRDLGRNLPKLEDGRTVGEALADFYYAQSRTLTASGLLMVKNAKVQAYVNDIAKAIGAKDGWLYATLNAEQRAVLLEAQGPLDTENLSSQAKAVRKIFEKVYKELGLKELGVAERKNFFPRVLAIYDIAGDDNIRANLINLLQQENPNVSLGNITDAVSELVKKGRGEIDFENKSSDDLDVGILKQYKPLFENVTTEQLANINAIESPEVALKKYLDKAVTRSEFEKRGGVKYLRSLMNQLSPEEQIEAQNIQDAIMGRITPISNGFLRVANNIGLVINIVTLLGFAVLASLPDLAGPVLRSRTLDTKQLFTVVKELSKNPQEMIELSKEIGVVGVDAMSTFFINAGEVDFMNERAKQISNGFFRLTGLEAFTRFSRVFATGMGKQFMIKHAEKAKAGDKTSQTYLKELQVTADEVLAWSKGDANAQVTEKVNQGLVRFVDEAIVRPNSAERPVWASDPRYALIWQLKSFYYAYGKTIMGGVFRDSMNRAKQKGAGEAVMPLLFVAMMLLPITMLGWEIREFTKAGLAFFLPGISPDDPGVDYYRTNTMTNGQYWTELIDRTGMLGPASMALPVFLEDHRHGKPFWLSPLGPTAERVYDGITWDWKVADYIPGYSQLDTRALSAGTL